MFEQFNDHSSKSEDKSLGTLFRLSFYYSQGDNFLQRYLFQWMAMGEYLDGVDIPRSLPNSLQDAKIPHRHAQLFTGYPIKIFESEWNNFVEVASWKRFNRKLLLEQIMKGMMDRDTVYQRTLRPARLPDIVQDPDALNDPHASFLRRHTILKHPAGHESYNSLFTDLSRMLGRYRNNPIQRAISGLWTLENNWENNHPNETFFPPSDSIRTRIADRVVKKYAGMLF